MLSAVAVAMDGTSTAQSAFRWYSFNAGLERAKADRKPIMIDFYADWCHWCRVMDRETFANNRVAGTISKHYIPIRLDLQSREMIRYRNRHVSPDIFSQMMGVTSLPAVVFLDKNGEVIAKVPGFVQAATFSSMLAYIRDECYVANISFQDYMNGRTQCPRQR